MNIKNENEQLTQTAKIKIKEINDIKNFVNIIKKYDFNIELASGNYKINAKSIIEVFSLDVSENINLIAYTNNANDLFKKIEKYIVK